MPVSDPRVLILGGTAEASRLAAALQARSIDAVTSLAGRTANPATVAGPVRSGGFGGIEGLSAYLTAGKFDLLIDATHPYATRISQNAIAAAKTTGIPLLRLERPAWQPQPGDRWIDIADETQAAAMIPKGERVFLALGRQHIAPFADCADAHFTLRMIDPPEAALPPHCEIVLAKPEGRESEKRFLADRKIGLIVCRNSGGGISYGKIEAARDLSIPVLMIARPPVLAETIVATVEDATGFACSILGS